MQQQRFGFRVDPRLRPLLLLWGVRASRAYVELGPDGLEARFGVLRVRTGADNLAGAEITGPYRWYTAVGIRESFVDHGLSFGSSLERGVCIRFRARVRGIGRRPRHPGLTVTVQEPERLRELVDRLAEAR